MTSYAAVTSPVLRLVERHKAGERIGVTSVCSAHPLVLEAAIRQAQADGGEVLVEATSNQVDQFGGYTGLQPRGFRDLVMGVADRFGVPRRRVLLGGDHLGPNTWRALGARKAMARAENLVSAYVAAGFSKLHLDCSMACAGDDIADRRGGRSTGRTPGVRGRTERRPRVRGQPPGLCGGHGGTGAGWARETIEALTPTSAAAAEATISWHREAFDRVGVGRAWERVVGLVVQPGVEFDHLRVVDYDPRVTRDLQQVLHLHPHLVFEAHSTDYQSVEALTALVADHWAVLKVGPGLTFALREALFALAAIEDALLPAARRSRLPEVVEQEMLAHPRWWEGYYPGDADEQRLARRYSYSDRMRYYWPNDHIRSAQQILFANLSDSNIPLPLLSAHLPDQYTRVRRGMLAPEPKALVVDRVRDVLRGYARVCATAASKEQSV